MKFLQDKKLLIFFVLLTYVIIPFVDSIACQDCINPISFQGRGVEISYLNSSNGNALSLSDIKTNSDRSAQQKDIKDFCSICFNAAKMINTHDTNAVFQSGSLAFQSESLTMLESAFSVIKPPHN